MMGLLNLGTTLKTQMSSGQDALTATQVNGQQSVGTSFGAFLAQVMAGDTTGEGAADPKLTKLALILGKFRSEAEDSLAEMFPDGVVVPGVAFNEWAQSMLTKLDGMLQGIGADLGDLAQILGPLDGLAALEGLGEGSMLEQAVEALVADLAEPGETLNPLEGIDLPEGALDQVPDTARSGDPVVARLVDAAGEVAEVVTDAAEAVEVAVKTSPQSAIQSLLNGVEDMAPDVPLPEPLRALLAQVVAAPADRGLPPEVQAILSTQQPAVAPVAAVAAVAPAQAPQPSPAPSTSTFARNLAGQIKGVSFTEGTTRIELTPQGLGKLEIEIAPDEAGKLRVVIRAENPAVLNAMRSDREMLVGLLRDGGTSVDDSAMSFEGFDQRGGTQTRGEAGGTASVSAGAVEEDDDAAEDAVMTEDGRLNILT